jgi:hypothetical protein
MNDDGMSLGAFSLWIYFLPMKKTAHFFVIYFKHPSANPGAKFHALAPRRLHRIPRKNFKANFKIRLLA